MQAKGQLDEAYNHFQQVIKLDPTNPWVQSGLRQVGMRLGRGNEVRLAWKNALDANPPEHEAWFGYAELCLFLGDDGEYRRTRRALLDRLGASTDPFIAERTGRACLLLPPAADELPKAVALIEAALDGGQSKYRWAHPFFMFAKGLAEYRQGRFESANSIMQGPASAVMGPGPALVRSMALYNLGKKEVSLDTLAAAILAWDWRVEHADERDAWIYHALRRQAEAMILPNLPGVVQKNAQPKSNNERLAMLGYCQFEGYWSTAARYYAEAFAAEPKLAEDRNLNTCYRAACCAFLAGSKRTDDGRRSSESERSHWRKQARAWLEADLLSLRKQAVSREAPVREVVIRKLTEWQADPALDDLHDPAALANSAPEERQQCENLWRGIHAVLVQAQDRK